MVVNKIDEVLSKTAELTSLPPEHVADVMAFFFSEWRSFLIDPKQPGFRVPSLGLVRSNVNRITHYLKGTLIKRLRKDPNNEELKEQFRT